jgi:diaminohydroxyphosphoribosylaminopyrimidine deaminase/5-amino-6-(5-phosphoribosylamino)uracil reductase
MNDEAYMRFALTLANQAAGQTSPNPSVGAVIVKDNEIAGFGAHLHAGGPHAEVHAVNMAGEKAYQATIYVTLEPCSHYGKTAPCADLLIETGIKRAVIACLDPNEKVAGKGIEKLRKAGIEVDVGILREEAEVLNQVFFHHIRNKTPYVTVKSAVSLDGKTATAAGESKWITGEAARLDVHQYRHQHDAILAGVNTVIADNPSLTTRLPGGGRNPVRVILDNTLRTPADAKVVTDQKAATWIFIGSMVTAQAQLPFAEQQHVKLLQVKTEKVDIEEVLQILGEKGITSVFVEGGSEINGSLLERKQMNQIITYIAPKLIGGKGAPTSFSGAGFQNMSEVLDLEIKSIETIGRDIKIVAEPGGNRTDVHRDH